MRVTQVLSARAARYVEYPRPPYLPDLIAFFRERYRFVHVPTTPEEILPTGEGSGILKGLLHGKLVHEGRTVVVESLTMYADAIAIESPISTEEADIVLDDLFSHAKGWFTEKPNRRVYASGLEFALEVPLDAAFRTVAAIGKTLTQLMGEYTDEPPLAFHLSGIRIGTDPTKGSAEALEIERRLNAPFESNLYYSSAPLSTSHHVSVLASVEAAIQESLRPVTASPSEPSPPSGQSGSAS